MRVQPIPDLDDRQVAEAARVWARDEAAADPTLAPIQAEELRRLATDDRRAGQRHCYLAAVVDGSVTAVAHVEPRDVGPNGHFASIHVLGLDAPHGDLGGRALLEHALDHLLVERHTTLMAWARSGPSPDAFWQSVGMTRSFASRISKVSVIDVDEEALLAWRSVTLDDFHTVRWTGICPSPHRAHIARLRDVMNDAPLDDLDLEATRHDVGQIVRDDQAWLDIGVTPLTVLAFDRAGTPAGYTRVHVNDFRPEASWQYDTAVATAFRGRGVARRLKAEMLAWLRADHPEVAELRTGNALSNSSMLSINDAMGFAPVGNYVGWQGAVPAIRAQLIRSSRTSVPQA